MSQSTSRDASRAYFSLNASCLFACLVALLTAPTFADVLVMKDGSRLEVEGEWREKGRVIEFTLPNGTLGSVRASEVDLEASGEATRLANAPPEEKPEPMDKPKPEPIAVWTDKDIPQAAPEVIAGAAAEVDAQAVQVTRWDAEPGGDDNVVAVIRGTLQNYGNNLVSGLSLSVTVTGNRAVGTNPSLVRQAQLDATSLDPGETTEFTVELRRGDVVNSGATVEEFQNPSATFRVLFESNPQDDAGAADDDGDGDGGDGDSGDGDSGAGAR